MLNMNAIHKTAVLLKEYSPKASRGISRVSVMHLLSFTQNLMLLDFAIDRKKKKKAQNTKSKKHSSFHSAMSRGSLMQ
jgi:hypothetical protein